MKQNTCMVLWALLAVLCTLLTSCAPKPEAAGPENSPIPVDIAAAEEATAPAEGKSMRITAEEARTLMENETDYILLDVRTQEEYNTAHLPGAILISDGELQARAEAELPNKAQLILLYCRTGRRSAAAAKLLAQMGYTNVKDFGGITAWQYETVTE